jgi:hypothetical protein
VIVGAAFCPHPPLLAPDVAQGAAAELDGLRTACRTAIRTVMTPGVRPLVIGAGERSRTYRPTARGSLAGFGVRLEIPLGSDEPGPVELPLSLTVGAWLLRDAVGPDSGAHGCQVRLGGVLELPALDADEPVALLVTGDGSARRSRSAPGYLDERAGAFDARLADALASGDPKLLRADALDAELGAELLVAGIPAWDAAAALLEPFDYQAELTYDAAPYGVGYFVAAWTRT